jgi:hypothetical protein
MEKELCYKTTALKVLGLTANAFDKLSVEPVKVVRNPHYRNQQSYLYDKEQIHNLRNTPEVLALKPTKRKPKDWSGIFYKRYPDETDAINAACFALFNLNRYAKHQSCSKRNKEEVYILKNKLIEWLYHAGYCQSVGIHKPIEKECFTCYGSGQWHDGSECFKCDGTGIYKGASFFVFRFNVDGQNYCWHQPMESISFHPDITSATDTINETEVKPLEISKSKLAESKALLKWVIENL